MFELLCLKCFTLYFVLRRGASEEGHRPADAELRLDAPRPADFRALSRDEAEAPPATAPSR